MKRSICFLLSSLILGILNPFQVFSKPSKPYYVRATMSLVGYVEVTWRCDESDVIYIIHRSKQPYSGYKIIAYTYNEYFTDFTAYPNVKPPKNVSATNNYNNKIKITWSEPQLLTQPYYYRIQCKKQSYPFAKSDKSHIAVGSMTDWLDTKSAWIVVANSPTGSYTTLAMGQPSPLHGESSYWHTGLPPGTNKYYRIRVLSEYSDYPSKPSSIAGGSTTGTPPLDVYISGPGAMEWLEWGTWTANVSGGTGSYSYEWRFREVGSSWSGIESTSRTYSHEMDHTDFELKVTVSDNSSSDYDILYVEYTGTWPPIPKRDGEIFTDLQQIPTTFLLEQNYPNPFNTTTEIRFQLPEPSHVSLSIYDINGRAVAHLIENFMNAGYHRWSWDAGDLPSGVYIVKLFAGKHEQFKRMILMK